MKLIKIILISICIVCSSFKEREKPIGCLKVDIMILADQSASVSGKEQFIHDAVYTFIDKFELSEEGIRIGLITFRNNAKLESHLSYYKDSLKIANNAINLKSAQGSTNLSDALILATQEFIDNGRQGVIKMIILITDGEPDNEEEATQYANLFKSMPGTMIWGIFVKFEYNLKNIGSMYKLNFIYTDGSDYLKSISSPNCFIDTDYNNLVEQVKKLDICL